MTNGTFGVTYEYFANGWLKKVKKGTQDIAFYGNGMWQEYIYDADPCYRLNAIKYHIDVMLRMILKRRLF